MEINNRTYIVKPKDTSKMRSWSKAATLKQACDHFEKVHLQKRAKKQKEEDEWSEEGGNSNRREGRWHMTQGEKLLSPRDRCVYSLAMAHGAWKTLHVLSHTPCCMKHFWFEITLQLCEMTACLPSECRHTVLRDAETLFWQVAGCAVRCCSPSNCKDSQSHHQLSKYTVKNTKVVVVCDHKASYSQLFVKLYAAEVKCNFYSLL